MSELEPIDSTTSIPIVDSMTGPQAHIDISNLEIPMGSAALVVVKGPQVGDAFVLSDEENSIGRNDSSQLMLDDVTVSRNHAVIERSESGWSIRDLGSLNGTFVNKNRVNEAILTGGEELQIGKYRFAFLLPTEDH